MLKFYKSTAGCGWSEHIDVVQLPNGKFLECGKWTNSPDRDRLSVYDYTDEMYYLTECSREEFLDTSLLNDDVLRVLEELTEGYKQ